MGKTRDEEEKGQRNIIGVGRQRRSERVRKRANVVYASLFLSVAFEEEYPGACVIGLQPLFYLAQIALTSDDTAILLSK